MKNTDTNPVGWFEIPVNDMVRAKQFYETVFGYNLESRKINGIDMEFFPVIPEKANGTAGALVYHKQQYEPSASHGPLIYFQVPDIDELLIRIRAAGGKTLMEKTLITDDIGYKAHFLDTEGNRIALFTPN